MPRVVLSVRDGSLWLSAPLKTRNKKNQRAGEKTVRRQVVLPTNRMVDGWTVAVQQKQPILENKVMAQGLAVDDGAQRECATVADQHTVFARALDDWIRQH